MKTTAFNRIDTGLRTSEYHFSLECKDEYIIAYENFKNSKKCTVQEIFINNALAFEVTRHRIIQ